MSDPVLHRLLLGLGAHPTEQLNCYPQLQAPLPLPQDYVAA